MGIINLETKDYVLLSLDATFTDDDEQAICQSLNIHRRKYWANPNKGSRLYTLRRSKDVPRMLQLVKQFAEEALEHLVPTRFENIDVTTTQSRATQIDLKIDVTRFTGQKQTIQYFVPVGG